MKKENNAITKKGGLTIVSIAGCTSTPPDDQAFIQVDIPASQETFAEVIEALAVEDEDAIEGVNVTLEDEEGSLEAGL